MPPSFRSVLASAAIASALLSAGCGTVKYTVDDGRRLDDAFVETIRAYGRGEAAIRPAVARSAALADPDCSRQWELPIAVATSWDLPEDDRVAWVRALQVDERLTVIGAAPDAGLARGERIVDVAGFRKDDGSRMLAELIERRDAGKPFPVKTANGRSVVVKPLEVCRGYTRLAPVKEPRQQDFHWLTMLHPIEVVRPELSADEALWMVLWNQGVSEEGGARMKTFHYSKEIAGALIKIAGLYSGVTGAAAAAEAAKIAAKDAATAAATAAAQTASEAAAKGALEAAARSAAEEAGRIYAQKLGTELAKAIGTETGHVLKDTFMMRVGLSVTALSWVASTVFDDADRWAYERMIRLGADPLAGATLHQKLLDRGLVQNAYVLDEERLGKFGELARKSQREEMFASVLRGASLDVYSLKLGELGSASHETGGMELASDAPPAGPVATADVPADPSFAMPLESGSD